MQNITKLGIVLVFVGLLTSTLAESEPPRNKQDDTMSHDTISVANAYYAAFQGTHSVTEVPMHNDLTFVSPRFTLTDADAFRGALSELFKGVRSLEINDQIHEGETVLTFYELDLGAPGGPISMAERLRVENGKLTSVDLIFDSARLPSSPSSEETNPDTQNKD